MPKPKEIKVDYDQGNNVTLNNYAQIISLLGEKDTAISPEQTVKLMFQAAGQDPSPKEMEQTCEAISAMHKIISDGGIPKVIRQIPPVPEPPDIKIPHTIILWEDRCNHEALKELNCIEFLKCQWQELIDEGISREQISSVDPDLVKRVISYANGLGVYATDYLPPSKDNYLRDQEKVLMKAYTQDEINAFHALKQRQIARERRAERKARKQQLSNDM